ncbi:hypothetical protein [Corynebacterium sp. UBA2622]|uniref:hypothetical protein n=1 Tax=Corynebacterium sp. UBA2622 TaxID=1946393 RepID=UPI0025B8655F|nr:hypothetical protein [Corynebacterium sp. UBA2622]
MHARRLASTPLTLVTAAGLTLGLFPVLTACSQVDPESREQVTELANEPEGFTPTADGEKLAFDEPAHVVTTSLSNGVPVYWDVTVHKPETLSPEQVEENIGQDPETIGSPPPERIRKYRCFPVTFTPRGDGLSRGQAPVSVSLPTLTPVDDNGTDANWVHQGDDRYCGTDRSRTVPAYIGDMRIGENYDAAVVTWEGEDDPGIVGTGVRLNTLPSPRNPSQPAQAINWAAK